MKDLPEYSVVIPVFNTNNSLVEISKRIKRVFLQQLNSSYELIFVDDFSSNDTTWATLRHIVAEDNNVQAIRLMRNFGQQAATICGIQVAKGNYVITMDDDLQHAPEDIPNLIKLRNHDIVIGQFSNKKHSLSKRMMSRVKGYFDQIILGKPRHIQLSPFRLINRHTVEGIKELFSTPYPFLPAMMLYVTKDIVGVEVSHTVRMEGETGYSFLKMLRLFSNLIINNSSFLLRLIGNLGLTISLGSFALAVYLIYQKMMHATKIVGWTSMIVAVLFMGGILLFSLGIIGEYLIRIIRGVDKWPNYIVREHLKQ